MRNVAAAIAVAKAKAQRQGSPSLGENLGKNKFKVF